MNRKAIIVGIDTYPDARLQGCVSDAKDISACLALEQYRFDCTELVNGQATRSRLLETLGEAAYGEETGDFLLIYFAGHGAVLDQHGYLVTVDYTQFDPGVSLAQMAIIMEAASERYRNVLLILDSCYSGSALSWVNARPIQPRDLDRELRNTNESRCILAACRPEQVAKEVDLHGLYTKALLDGLLGDAVDFRGEVSVLALHEHAARVMAQEGAQTPVFRGDLAGVVVLGSGFPPRIGKPIPVDEEKSILAKAQGLVDGYYSFEQVETADWTHRQAKGAESCARKLAPILDWFTETEAAHSDIARAKTWRTLSARTREFQSKLANIHLEQMLPWGRVIEHLGNGGFGQVWRLESKEGAQAAFKVFHGTELTDEVKAKRFSNGYANMAKLDHPRIVKVFSLTSAPFGFLMQSVPGQNLRDHYFDRRDVEACLRLIVDIAETVAHAHGRGVRHRDIKPENVIVEVDPDGRLIPFLTDFDLAYHETNRTITRNLGVGGVINYAAPEQFYSPNAVLARAETVDVYALAQLAFFIITYTDPAPEAPEKNASSLRKHLNEWIDGSAAQILHDLYVKCTHRNALDRLQTVSEFAARVSEAEALYLSASMSDDLTEAQFLERIGHIYAGIGAYVASDRSLEFLNLSGQVQVIVRIRGYSGKTSSRMSIELELSATRDIPVKTLVSGAGGRQSINARLDKVLSRIPNTTRHPGNKGVFQTYIEIREIPLSGVGAASVVRVIHAGISAIEAW